MWRPRLRVSFGKGGGVSSPATTAGYLLTGGIALALSIGSIAAALSGNPLMLLGLVITGVFLRDCWAWFASSDQERSAFREELARLRPDGRPEQTIDLHWGAGAFLILIAAIAGCALLFERSRDPSLLIVAMCLLSLLVVGVLDWVRERRAKTR